METKIIRKHSPEYKAKVCLEVLKERSTIQELSKRFNLHPTQINNWKKHFVEHSSQIFEVDKKGEKKSDQSSLIQSLYAQIGEQKVALDFLKKKFI